MDAETVREAVMELGALTPLSESLRGKVAELLSRCGKVLRLNAGDVLIHEGDVGGGAGFVLLEGRMLVTHGEDPSVTIDSPALLGEMHQFNPRAQRTATVTAEGDSEVLKFSWFDFQFQATSDLTHDEQDALMCAMEQLVWQRFQHESIFNVPAFQYVDEPTRLRLCLTLVWLAKDVHLPQGAVLFQQQEPQGGTGYVLLEGEIAFARAGQPFGQVFAPALVGSATDFDPRRTWSATAAASATISLMKFEWPELEAYLIQRIGEPQTRAAFAKIEQASRDGFIF